jgi:hypothetical protein
MKKAILGVILLLMMAPGSAETTGAHIGLYTSEAHSSSCATGYGFYPVEVWICCLPGDRGMICAEFAVQYPSNIIKSTVTENDDIISVMMGDLESGMSVCYIDCLWSWHWNFHQLIYVTDAEPAWIELVPHPGTYSEEVYFATCEPG